MKKELKELIKTKKLSDDQIIKIIKTHSEPERDIKDEDDEPESQPDSNEVGEEAEDEVAPKEEPQSNKTILSKDLVEELVKQAVSKALAENRKAAIPKKTTVRKPEPIAHPKKNEGFEVGKFNLVC